MNNGMSSTARVTDATSQPLTRFAVGAFLSASTLAAAPHSIIQFVQVQEGQTKQYLAGKCPKAITVDDSSTAIAGDSIDTRATVEVVMQLGHGTYFEDGIETAFSSKLLEAIRTGGSAFVEALHDFVMSGRADEEVAAEAFRWIGGMEDPRTHESRWRLLVSALRYPSLHLRDGAVMGLAAMGDRRSVAHLLKAFAAPWNHALAADIQRLVRLLQ